MMAGVDPSVFRRVMGQFCTGITIITTVHENKPTGFACQSFAALSLQPPLVLFCPSMMSRSWRAINDSGVFGVNVLAEQQRDICVRFGSKESDKFTGIDWYCSPLGSAVLAGSLAYIDCTVESVHDGGDHCVVLGRVHSLMESDAEPDSGPDADMQRPLLFYRGKYIGLEPDVSASGQWRYDLNEFLPVSDDDA